MDRYCPSIFLCKRDDSRGCVTFVGITVCSVPTRFDSFYFCLLYNLLTFIRYLLFAVVAPGIDLVKGKTHNYEAKLLIKSVVFEFVKIVNI